MKVPMLVSFEDMFLTVKDKQLKVKFNRESFLNDVLTCTTYKTDTPKLYVHKIEKDDVSVCDISTLWQEKADTSTIVDYPLKIKG